jgi:diguanylate cyclase (GGDEF)-like protein
MAASEVEHLQSELDRARTESATLRIRLRELEGQGQAAEALRQLSDRIHFARTEADLAYAAWAVLRYLAPNDHGDILRLDRLRDRLTVVRRWGEPLAAEAPAGAERINDCLGVRQGWPYLSGDLASPLALRCPAHPADVGWVLCMPMSAFERPMGVIHLGRVQSPEFDLREQQAAFRVGQQVALAFAERARMREAEQRAYTDPLTGLANRRLFETYLPRALRESQEKQEPLGLVMLDIDDFKSFNTRHLQEGGDQALKAVARAMRSVVTRDRDRTVRLGGEEFVLLLRGADRAVTAQVAERVRTAIQDQTIGLPTGIDSVTASFGGVSTDTHGHDPKLLLRAANLAMQASKTTGKNRTTMAWPMTQAPAPMPTAQLWPSSVEDLEYGLPSAAESNRRAVDPR